MMHFALRALLDRGVAPERIHVSLERNMRCGVGHCGHCQLGPTLICRDGPVYPYADLQRLLEVREL
jgi:NAD(P)H-flavin reductase